MSADGFLLVPLWSPLAGSECVAAGCRRPAGGARAPCLWMRGPRGNQSVERSQSRYSASAWMLVFLDTNRTGAVHLEAVVGVEE